MRHRSHLALAGAATVAVALSIASLSCDSPFEPRGEGERVPIGEVIEHEVASGALRAYSFLANGGDAYAVFLEATSGSVYLSVLDSVTQRQIADLFAQADGRPLDETATPDLESARDVVYVLRVRSTRDSAAQYRFMVYRIDRTPEHRSSWFSIGDTVAGEDIDPRVDGDDFRANGFAGEQIVAVLDAQAPGGGGVLSLGVAERATGSGLGYVIALSGEPPSFTTGRVRLPGTGVYEFKIRTPGSYHRYRGPYRFWSYRVNPAPERISSVAPIGAEISREAIDRAGDVDEFTLQGAPGSEVNAFLDAPRDFRLEVVPPNQPVLAEVTAEPGSAAKRATGRFKLTGTGPYTVRVSGSSPTVIADTGTYAVLLYPIDRAPESVPAPVAPRDTVDEAIDVAGDIDEFTFPATAGQEFNVVFQNLSANPDGRQHLVVLGPVTPAAEAWSPSFPPDTLAQATGRFAAEVTGTYAIRVDGGTDITDRDVGPYRLCLYAIDRRPEHVPQTLAFGDSLAGEAMDVPGDVDEFHFTVPDTSSAMLVVRLGADSSAEILEVKLLDSATGTEVSGALVSGANEVGFSQRVLLPPGSYRIQVRGQEGRSRLQGEYDLWLYRFRMGPEMAADTIAVGDTISVETIEPPGDEDDFRFYGTKGQHVNVALQGMAAPSSGTFVARLNSPVPYLNPVVTVISPTSAAALADHQSLRLDLPVTGWYTLTVTGGDWAETFLAEHGPYRLALASYNTGPEQVSPSLTPGDSVTDELIDQLGDWDEYTVAASPGQELGVVFQGLATTGYAYVVAWDAESGDSLAGVVGQGQQLAGPFKAPASGQVTLAVFEPRGYSYVGGYRLHVVPINRAPESIPAAYAVGDTVRGEAIFPAGDIDEFTSSGTPGDTLSFWCRLAANPVPDGRVVTFHVIDPATGAVLLGWGVSLWQSLPTYTGLGAFTVPAAGNYLIRVTGKSTYFNEVGTAPYEFSVKRGP